MAKLSVNIIPQYIQYRPYNESPREISDIINPKGKDIINIAAYGGYALRLLMNGANNVKSIDISKNSINANNILKTLILCFDYNGNIKFMKNLTSRKEKEKLSELSEVSMNYILNYFSGVKYNVNHFPQLKNKENFEIIKRAIKDERWQIYNSELLIFLEKQEPNSTDAIHASTVRNWILNSYIHKFDGEAREKWTEEFDKPLAISAYNCLKPGGVFIDALPPDFFPQLPLDLFGTWKQFNFPKENYKSYSIGIKPNS